MAPAHATSTSTVQDSTTTGVVAAPLVDAHCHLEEETYGAELSRVLQSARSAGLRALIAVGATRVADGADEATALAERHADIFATAGIHPQDAEQASEAARARIARHYGSPKVVCVGEVGLDYFHPGDRKVQRSLFEYFLRMADRVGLPIMLHIRDAHDDAIVAIDSVGVPKRGGMVHCFTAGPEVAAQYLARGFLLSIPGVVTYKNAQPLQEAVPTIPGDRLLVETDSPYLAPVPHRGKRNEPAHVVHTVQKVAELRRASVRDVAQCTTANAERFFGLPAIS